MTARLVPLIIACLILLNALLSGALAEATDCGEVESAGSAATDHADHASHDSAGASDEPDRYDNGLHESLGCHNGGSGCPGCLAPLLMTTVAPTGSSVTYPLSDYIGRSLQLTDSFRPPITSL